MRGERLTRVVGAVLLVLVTVVCLSSMGGAMLFAFPVLVPLHWWAARHAGPVATGGWALLAGLSMFEAGWMVTYLLVDAEEVAVAAGVVVGLATAVGFVSRRASLVPAGSSAV